MRTIASSAALRVAEFGTQELSNLTWGLATLGILCEELRSRAVGGWMCDDFGVVSGGGCAWDAQLAPVFMPNLIGVYWSQKHLQVIKLP